MPKRNLHCWNDLGDPIMVTTTSISYSIETEESVGNIDAVISNVSDPATSQGIYSVPLFVIADVGPGVSNKRIRIEPDYVASKNSTFMYYILTVSDTGNDLELVRFSARSE